MSILSKNQLKFLASYRLQKRCDDEGVFVVEGIKMCNEALLSGFRILYSCATADYLASAQLGTAGGEVYEVTPEQLERLSNMKTPNKIWMLVERKTGSGKRETGSEERLTLALDGLQDPGNMGTIMRTADWYGIRHIVCSRDTVSCYNPKVVQATMGAVFRTTVEYVDLAEWLDNAAGRGIVSYGAMMDGEDYRKVQLHHPAVLVIGNEGRGISQTVSEKVGHKLTIPNLGGTCESLNAAVATAILTSNFF